MSAPRPDTETAHALLAADLRRWFARRAPADQVDDLVQETFLRIHTRLDDLRDPDRLAPWVYRIARSVWVDRGRRRRPEQPSAVGLTDEDLSVTPAPPDPTLLVAAWLPGLVETLPEPYREAVRLSELEGHSQAEVARMLGISPSGARSRVQRGRRLLREQLEACCTLVREGAQIIDYAPNPACAC